MSGPAPERKQEILARVALFLLDFLRRHPDVAIQLRRELGEE